jgi:broad specificity phosphatase PhoE
MTKVYLIRHGRPLSSWGGGDDDPGLDATGHAQAEAIAERLIGLPDEARPRRVVSSPLRRCQETAQPFARALGVKAEIDPRVGEIPTPAGLPHADRSDWLKKAFAGRWSEIEGDLDYEAWRSGVADAVLGHAGAAVFSHFVAINAVATLLAGDPNVIGFRPAHGSMTLLALEAGQLKLLRLGAEAATEVL